MPVHDIHMDPARSGCLGFGNLFTETGKICRKNGGSNQEAFRHCFQTRKRQCIKPVHRMGGLYTKYTHNQNGTSPSTATSASRPRPTETQSISGAGTATGTVLADGRLVGTVTASGVRD